ncbi:uncharacterized protein LOC103181101 [Callorhinchus milii]|uniref:uncharacterized protein LOC103181101 n=1 Tax=Callorhinchus milii TaxID=7868 RepID=UPI001C3FD011|nr:uncharacterized protein LOC103181101 [Callorhinchus milii]
MCPMPEFKAPRCPWQPRAGKFKQLLPGLQISSQELRDLDISGQFALEPPPKERLKDKKQAAAMEAAKAAAKLVADQAAAKAAASIIPPLAPPIGSSSPRKKCPHLGTTFALKDLTIDYAPLPPVAQDPNAPGAHSRPPSRVQTNLPSPSANVPFLEAGPFTDWTTTWKAPPDILPINVRPPSVQGPPQSPDWTLLLPQVQRKGHLILPDTPHFTLTPTPKRFQDVSISPFFDTDWEAASNAYNTGCVG